MAAKTFLLSLLLSILAALPLSAAYSEVIPGPGLPSLASLGLTSEELYTRPFEPISESPLVLQPAQPTD